MSAGHQELIVITGGPGAGKTTLIEHLRRAGLAVMPEAGRAIIQEQTAIGGRALPWLDPVLFAELMLLRDIRSYRAAQRRIGTVFFDHAIPCVAGYLRLLGRDVPAHVEAAVAAFRYRRRVFVAPPWPEIYQTDSERRQSLDEAERTYDAMVEAYAGYGYDLVELPRSDIADRVRFVLDDTRRQSW
ncbi:MAG TPA: AAA family ATPase [Mycobacteriales bacterium]|nr:AAA family ATPase [Mycobacteriales bacterium]